MIEVSLQKGQEGLNIARRAMGHGNYKGLTDGMIISRKWRRGNRQF
jgi:hypothetical protein